NNCKANDTVVLAQPPALNFSANISSEKCDRNDGSIFIQATGGTPGFSYSVNNNPFINDSVFTSLDSGSYHITIIDMNGCVDSADILVPFSDAPIINSINVTGVLCNNGNSGVINIQSSGGSGNLLFSIDNGINFSSSNMFDSLAANTYS